MIIKQTTGVVQGRLCKANINNTQKLTLEQLLKPSSLSHIKNLASQFKK